MKPDYESPEKLLEYMRAKETAHARNFERRLKVISQIKSKRFSKAVKDLITDAGAYSLHFVKHAKGNKQDSDFPPIKYEWVDQTCNGGYTGDDFSGDIYIKIKKDRYLKIAYSC